jgi:hypothetical protein
MELPNSPVHLLVSLGRNKSILYCQTGRVIAALISIAILAIFAFQGTKSLQIRKKGLTRLVC